METPKDYTNTNDMAGITRTTTVRLRPANPNTPDDLNINISIRPTGEKSFTTDVYVQGLTEPDETVAFLHELAHQIGHEVLERCIKRAIVETALEQAAMDVMVDNAIDQILGNDE